MIMDKLYRFLSAGMLAASVLLASCSGKSIFDKNGKHDIPVKVMEVEKMECSGTRSYVGTASASKSAMLSCRYPGRLVKLNIRKGDYVEAGEVLAEIESYSVISSRDLAHAALKQAEDGYERAKKVHGSGSLADVKMVEVETRLAQARATAQAADAAFEECRIKAPFSGVVQEVILSEGVEVSPAEGIARLLDISSIEIDFPVPEKELGKIVKGSPAMISIPALGLEDIDAVVTSKGIFASPLSHTYECTMVPVGKIPGLMPGMVVKAYIDSNMGDGIIIPAAVIRTDMDGRYVWTVSEDGMVSKTYVVPSGFSGKGVVITEGLSAGDRIITDGVQKVCTGMKVKVME